MADEAIELVRLRNNFYRDNYRRIVMALLVCILLVVGEFLTIVYLITHRPAPVYFATADGWRLQPMVPLSTPLFTEAQVIQWATNAVINIYNYNFVNYRQQLQNSSSYFTSDGFQQFLSALDKSNTLDTVTSKKLVVSAIVSQSPVVVNEGLIRGQYAWRLQMPIIVTLQSASEQLSQSLILTVLIVRAPTLEKTSGVAIAQFIEAPNQNAVLQ